jgi:DNA-binding XRE family transcriptional regulator
VSASLYELVQTQRSTRSICRVEGCEKSVSAHGLCRGHLARLERTGTLERNPAKPAIEDPRCAYDGCARRAEIKGFCRGHHLRVRTSADKEHLLPPEARAERCLAPECNDPQYASGVCRSHWEITRREGEAWAIDRDVVLPTPPTIGGRVVLERARQGLTQDDLAKMVGVSRQRIQQLETMTRTKPHTLKPYAEALGVPLDYLMHGVAVSDLGLN